MKDDDTGRMLGSLDARMTLMETRVMHIETAISERLDRLEHSLNEVHGAVLSAHGAWKAVMWVAGIAGGVATVISIIVHWFAPRP